MRQFDVLVWGQNVSEDTIPPFSDPDLGWFYGSDLNKNLSLSDAEWIVIAHSSIQIDRDFLNDLAQSIDGFPMVDAFAPRIAIRSKSNQNASLFLSGSLIHPSLGFSQLEENSPLRFVAIPHPAVVAFSRRIIQRTGRLDEAFSIKAQLADYSLRMLHAGGKMFSVPYLVANSEVLPQEEFHQDILETALILYKSFGFEAGLKFLLRHPTFLLKYFSESKAFKEKRKKATLLSKLKADTLKEITYAKAK